MGRLCEYCKNKLQVRQRKFCCSKCRNNWLYQNNKNYKERKKENSKKRYEENKNNPEYVKVRRKQFEEWRSKYPERFNKLMRNGMRKRHTEFRKKGLCICGNKRVEKIWKMCETCRERKRKYAKKRRMCHQSTKVSNIYNFS